MPLEPILMRPAFRHGALTPWGGDRLRGLYHKDAPPQTGESLELSAIKGLESRDGTGRTLGELLALYGQRLAGRRVADGFPLLIKLIDAREKLSVQVHPDDAYALARHGKPGKNEAWVILMAEPGAELVLGLKDGAGLDELKDAAEKGAGLDALLRRKTVKPGEVYPIPAGTVHAIGAGILLYEVQQSSDLTYRLYDWERVGADGRRRELHLRDSLNVIQPGQRPQDAVPNVIPHSAAGRAERLLDNPYFQLDRLRDCAGFQLMPDTDRFSALTALGSLRLDWEGGSLSLEKGQTALLPADGYPLSIDGKEALLARPPVS